MIQFFEPSPLFFFVPLFFSALIRLSSLFFAAILRLRSLIIFFFSSISFCFCFSAIFFSSLKSSSVASFFWTAPSGGGEFWSFEKYPSTEFCENYFFYLSTLKFLGGNCFSCQHLFSQQNYRPWGRCSHKHIERSFDFQLAFSLASKIILIGLDIVHHNFSHTRINYIFFH